MNINFLIWLNNLKKIDTKEIYLDVDKMRWDIEIEKIIEEYKKMHPKQIDKTNKIESIEGIEVYFDDDLNSKYRLKIENIENQICFGIPKQFCDNVKIRFIYTAEYQKMQLRNDLIHIKNKYGSNEIKNIKDKIDKLIEDF